MAERVTDQEVGQRLRAARERAGMPQQHVAVTMAVIHGHPWHQSTVTRVEAGERSLRYVEALSVAEVIGIPVDDLRSDKPTRLERGARLAEVARMRESLQGHLDAYAEQRIRELG